MTAEQRRARAYAARAALDDPLLKEGFAEIESDLHREWENCSRFQRSKRERIWNELRHLKALRQKLASYAGHARD